MAISREQALANFHRHMDSTLVAVCETIIDRQLCDFTRLKSEVIRIEGKCCWKFMLSSALTDSQRSQIEELYRNKGWKNVFFDYVLLDPVRFPEKIGWWNFILCE